MCPGQLGVSTLLLGFDLHIPYRLAQSGRMWIAIPTHTGFCRFFPALQTLPRRLASAGVSVKLTHASKR